MKKLTIEQQDRLSEKAVRMLNRNPKIIEIKRQEKELRRAFLEEAKPLAQLLRHVQRRLEVLQDRYEKDQLGLERKLDRLVDRTGNWIGYDLQWAEVFPEDGFVLAGKGLTFSTFPNRLVEALEEAQDA